MYNAPQLTTYDLPGPCNGGPTSISLEQGNSGGDEYRPCRPGLESKVADAFGPWPGRFGSSANELPSPPISRDQAVRQLPAQVHADETHAVDDEDAHTQEVLHGRLGDRDGCECQAAVAERARSSDPRGAAAAAGERPRREAEEEPTVSDGPWLQLT